MYVIRSNPWRTAFFVIVAINLAYGVPKVIHKMQSIKESHTVISRCSVKGEAYLDLIIKANRAMLRRQNGMTVVCETPWDAYLVAVGPMTYYQVTHDHGVLADIEKHIDTLIDKNGDFKKPVTFVDQCAIGAVLCDLYETTKKERYKTAAGHLASYLCSQMNEGQIPYRHSFPEYMLIDTLGMTCEFLTHFANLTKRHDYADVATTQLIDFFENGIDDKTNLAFHAYRVGEVGGSGVLGWCRGEGWMLLGLVGTLEHLDKQHPAYPRLRSMLSESVSALERYQEPEGCWKWAVNVEGARIDTSGSAMVAFAIQRAIVAGVLDRKWERVTKKALSGLMAFTSRDGVLMGALKDVNWVGDYPQVYTTSVRSQGPAVGLAALLMRSESIERQPKHTLP